MDRRNSALRIFSRITRTPREADASGNRYHAVSIHGPDVPENAACYAARTLKGKRFLSSEAPALPLAGCDNAECNCRYVHHHDRRNGVDRRHPMRRTQRDDERRQTGERRALKLVSKNSD